MKRLGLVLVPALLAMTLTGCGGGGIEEGMSTAPAAEGGAPPGFREMMNKDAEKMKIKGKPKSLPAAEKPADKPAETPAEKPEG